MEIKKIVTVSGGADSTAVALLMYERGEDFELLFSDTGAELPEVYYLLPRLAETVGKPLHVVSGGGFFSMLVSRGFFIPGPRTRWCTGDLKIKPQDKFMAEHNTEVAYIGIRADEPKRLKPNARPLKGKHFFEYPLADAGYGKKEVMEICRKYDLLNPVYKWRTNVSCFCCFFQRVSDWYGLMQYHPALYHVAEEWERWSVKTSKKGYTWRQGTTLEAMRKEFERQKPIWPEMFEPKELCAFGGSEGGPC